MICRRAFGRVSREPNAASSNPPRAAGKRIAGATAFAANLVPNTAVGAFARSTDTALMLLAGIDASFDFDFNDYLHIASLSAVPQPCATARNVQNPDLVHFPLGNFLTSSVIIVSPVSGNRLRPHINTRVGSVGLSPCLKVNL